MSLAFFGKALRRGAGGAGFALGSSFFALGALFGESGLSVAEAAAFSFFTFALPAQLVAAQMFADGAGAAAVVVAVVFVNARLVPMTVSLLPLLRPARARTVWDFALAHFLAVTSWVFFMNTYREEEESARLLWFAQAAVFFWTAGVAATVAGHFAGASLPPHLLVGLLFLNPAYFLFMMLRSLARKSDAAAMAMGMLLLPPARFFFPEWDALAAGIVGGTAAFLFSRGGGAGA